MVRSTRLPPERHNGVNRHHTSLHSVINHVAITAPQFWCAQVPYLQDLGLQIVDYLYSRDIRVIQAVLGRLVCFTFEVQLCVSENNEASERLGIIRAQVVVDVLECVRTSGLRWKELMGLQRVRLVFLAAANPPADVEGVSGPWKRVAQLSIVSAESRLSKHPISGC